MRPLPIDSNAEEVHALGLKKFVEEAKLLWNLSTPSRHPNIVSVRSLFEIHGTAYIVMDFEDGVSLSKLIRQGQRWNERSLLALVKPIAEGLERAHRVGVLHRDIKPPNILINDNGRPVLIDFGSARFDTAEATSTKVTFHTPPYAAIEQYVKTFEQGPWTDIYALGVVLYECITGAKPAEVLERMHGSVGQPLAQGEWPGYSKRFLAAIDSAMAVRPEERPQSISEWLVQLDGAGEPDDDRDIAEEVTRIVPFDVSSDAIVPIAPPAAGFAPLPADIGVPDRPSKAEFKRVGRTVSTTARDKKPEAKAAALAAASAVSPAAPVPKAAPADSAPPLDRSAKAALASDAPKDPVPPATGKRAEEQKRDRKPMLVGAAAVAVLAIAGVGWSLSGGSPVPAGEPVAVPASTSVAPSEIGLADLGEGSRALADEAKQAGIEDSLLAPFAPLAEEFAKVTPGDAPAVGAGLRQRALNAHVGLASGLLRLAGERTNQLAREVPWADPATTGAGQTGERQAAAANIRTSLDGLRAASERASASTEAGQSLAAARDALARYRDLTVGILTATALHSKDRPRLAEVEAAPLPSRVAAPVAARSAAETTAAPVRSPAQVAAAPALPNSDETLSPATTAEFRSIIAEGRDMARQVIRMGERARAGSTPAEREAYELLRSNMQLARTYDSSLASLRDSFGSVRTDREAEGRIKQARQTRAYLVFLVKRSTDASRR